MHTQDTHLTDYLPPETIQSLAKQFGTPLWLYRGDTIKARIQDILSIAPGGQLQARFAMKACPNWRVLSEMKQSGIWLDTVSGNEVLRGLNTGFPGGMNPPVIFLTCDVFRDNALDVVLEHGILPNLGSPGMVEDLAERGYQGPVSLRLNPGFGHGHVNECDTGGPSSKHGIWHEDVIQTARTAEKAGMLVTMLHAHIGSGPQFSELLSNLNRLVGEFRQLLPSFPAVQAVSLGGGIPHDYRGDAEKIDLQTLGRLLSTAQSILSERAGRPLRLEIEPGRYFTASGATLVTRVHDVKQTRSNSKGTGSTFAMVDAGFTDLVRPAMYGSYHDIRVVGKETAPATHAYVVAGPLCESGDVFTRDSSEMLAPRPLPEVKRGDLLCIRDAGAYGYAMSSNYNSLGRAPQLWLEPDGAPEIISRRETIDDILTTERNPLDGR